MDTHDKQRRILLRGALLSGCAVAVPALLSGCDSPQNTPDTGTSDGGSTSDKTSQNQSSQGEMTTAQKQDDGSAGSPNAAKISQQQAQYRGEPNGTEQCSGCLHFNADSGTCKLVEGQISPNGWCSLWAKK